MTPVKPDPSPWKKAPEIPVEAEIIDCLAIVDGRYVTIINRSVVDIRSIDVQV